MSTDLLRRVDDVEGRLSILARSEPPSSLTNPDERTGERWEWGQAWAHTVEFVPYWIRQVRKVLAEPAAEPPAFGRVSTDPERVDAIERDRHEPTETMFARLSGPFEDLRALIREMTPEDWAREVRHSTLGVMAMPKVFEVFLVGHLESHADQLDGLSSS
jgi:hypothetical protein